MTDRLDIVDTREDLEVDESSLPPPYQEIDHGPPPSQTSTSPSSSLYYRRFPSTMTIKAGLSRSFTICDAVSNEAIYLAEFHPSGWSCTKPLGARAGFILHNGVSSNDAILAAAGDITVFEQRINPFCNRSHILLPPLQTKENTQALQHPTVTEVMTGKITAEKGIVFRFSVEAGRVMQRQTFEWRKLAKDDSWQLVRHPSSLRKTSSDGEVVATLSWVPVLLAIALDPLNVQPICVNKFPLLQDWAKISVRRALC
ncbi:uncharacterized protein TRIREDRAFT_111808 [Trichoderma reesei QM6a]|uniref:Predicted protein n=1 Tax=Hypocrea jecorina (strain QM6a) TaxID=431241 RepID=G0RVG8_HYPJQ|nr:uncharacterized protein TRIREDRAFT_111808 [Trichoderma reesei QM6a]EGR44866.1 predicted protein [Trichoderma reesei QM6a]